MDCVYVRLHRTATAKHARKTHDASLSSPYYYILHYCNVSPRAHTLRRTHPRYFRRISPIFRDCIAKIEIGGAFGHTAVEVRVSDERRKNSHRFRLVENESSRERRAICVSAIETGTRGAAVPPGTTTRGVRFNTRSDMPLTRHVARITMSLFGFAWAPRINSLIETWNIAKPVPRFCTEKGMRAKYILLRSARGRARPVMYTLLKTGYDGSVTSKPYILLMI